jgi:hypothetical protein
VCFSVQNLFGERGGAESPGLTPTDSLFTVGNCKKVVGLNQQFYNIFAG